VTTLTAAARGSVDIKVPSAEMLALYTDLRALGPEYRPSILEQCDGRALAELLRVAQHQDGTPYALWQDDPVGFIGTVLQETMWSKQREVAAAVGAHKRVAVPAGFGVSKTHGAARLVVWRGCVFPPGTSVTVTTATRMRQVSRQLWPHVRTLVKKHGLPGHCDLVQWKAPDKHGVDQDIGYGFSAPANDESAVQGIHAPRLFIVVDESGGIALQIGDALRGLLTGEDTKLLAIGNPPTDNPGSWFEKLCETEGVHVVRIAATDAPLLTGERTGPCRACPSEVAAHPLGVHLVDRDWVETTIREHGADSPYVVAKVNARFPKGGSSRAIPSGWVDMAVETPDEAWGYEAGEDGWLPLGPLCLDPDDPDRGNTRLVQAAHVGADGVPIQGDWVRLGVDVAADGGDEFSIARTVGTLGTIRHASSGAANANPHDVAGIVLGEILRAERLRTILGTKARVRVKIDAIGVGWGVTGILNAWGPDGEGLHNAEIVGVVVSEGVQDRKVQDAATLRPNRKRDEMWLATRSLLAPDRYTGLPVMRLAIEDDKRTRAQLSAPNYGTSATGKTVIESKKSMKARGVSSPDRAEAMLLALYEPSPPKKKGRLLA